jgi:hypothetical protein
LREIDSSISSANSSGVFTVPSGRSPAPWRAVANNLRHESRISSPVADAFFTSKVFSSDFLSVDEFFSELELFSKFVSCLVYDQNIADFYKSLLV